MRKTVAVSALALLFLTACAAQGAGPARPSAAEQTATAKPSATAKPAAAGPSATGGNVARDSVEETCRKLLGANGDGPLWEVNSLVRIDEGTSGFAGTAETARALHEEVQNIATDATPDVELLLREFSPPLENTILIAEKPGSAWTFNPDTWVTAFAHLQSTCAPYNVG